MTFFLTLPHVSIKKNTLSASSSKPSSANTVLNKKLRLNNIGEYFVFTYCMETSCESYNSHKPRVYLFIKSVLLVNKVINMPWLEQNSLPNGQMQGFVSFKSCPQEVEKEKEVGK